MIFNFVSDFYITHRRTIDRPDPASKEKRHATVTIILLTVAYIVLNIPVWLTMVAQIFIFFNFEDYALIWNLGMIQFVFLNSTVNAFIFFCRNQGIRNFAKAQVSLAFTAFMNVSIFIIFTIHFTITVRDNAYQSFLPSLGVPGSLWKDGSSSWRSGSDAESMLQVANSTNRVRHFEKCSGLEQYFYLIVF